MMGLLENDFLLAVIAFAIVLIPAIIIHELGHFFAAKMIGVNVLEFGIGFPPKAVRLFTWGETEFTLNWLPIGGFVRPLGEDFIGPVDENSKNDEARAHYLGEREELRRRGVPESKMLSVNEAKPLPRIWFMVAGALANFVSAIAVFIIVALIGLPTIIGERVQLLAIAPSSPLSGVGIVAGDAIERINGETFVNREAFWQAWLGARGKETTLSMRRLSDGEAYEVVVTPQASALSAQVRVSSVLAGSAALEVDLRADDVIVAVDGKAFNLNANPAVELQDLTAPSAGKSMRLTVLRGDNTLEIDIVPRLDNASGKGRMGIGILAQYATDDGLQWALTNPREALIPQPFDAAVSYGVTRFATTIALIVSIPQQLIDGTISPEEARPVSIVGISQVGGQFLKQSVTDGSPSLILNFFALISIFLGFTNLLPLPPLDGGRVVFALIELVRRKPVPLQVENLVYRIGIIFLLSLGGIVILYDIINPFVLPQ